MSIMISALESAILQTVVYADVFDYPLTESEIHRYLVGKPATLAEVRAALAQSPRLRERLVRRGRYILLAGREGIVAIREHREQVAQRLWPQALHYAALMEALPFVRMVAVTGSLAVNNVDEDGDIDYLIVTSPGRLWLCRAMVVGLVKMAERRGVVLCPNFFLSERALTVEPHNLFTARELAQMRPLFGMDVYTRMRRVNDWLFDFLPNAVGPPPMMNGRFRLNGRFRAWRPLRGAAERVLGTRLGAKAEQWEMTRKIDKFRHQFPHQDEAAFSPDWCKGHFDGHAHRILDVYARRIDGVEEKRSKD
ncbi:MAG: hypothetical protein GXP42_16770 [Chloroflexi bacterium]|nr:hypothetical protein [Chloroflexota bacterium]